MRCFHFAIVAHNALQFFCAIIASFPVWLKLMLINCLRWTPPMDYWQTDNSNGLVMVIRNYHWLNSASWVLISTAPNHWFKRKRNFSLFNLYLWPTTLTYNPRLAKVKVDPYAKNQGQTVQTGECPQTNGRTHTRTHMDATKRIISPARRSINIHEAKMWMSWIFSITLESVQLLDGTDSWDGIESKM